MHARGSRLKASWRTRAAVAIAAWACASAGLAAGAGSGARAATCGGFENPCSQETEQQFTYGSVQREDTPNDPSYDQSEPDTQQPPERRSSNLYAERFDLFGFPSELTRSALYTVGPHAGEPMVAGFNASGAWKAERGRPDAVVAILDDGIDWSRRGLRDQIHLNTGELPYPERSDGSSCAAYDCNGDGVVNVEDYAEDPRVSLSWAGRRGPAGLITAQDLIHAFGDCKIDEGSHLLEECVPGAHFDNDGNGFANDIAGWNFFDNNNEPADLSSYFAAYHHGTDRALDAAEQGNDGEGSIGVCPKCQIMPVRTWDTFVSDGNDFALGMVYATDNGAKVIEGANGSLYHSAFAEAASQYAYEHGAVQIYSGDDLNTADHNYPGDYGHAMLIQGSVNDTEGLGEESSQWLEGEKLCGLAGEQACLGSNVPVEHVLPRRQHHPVRRQELDHDAGAHGLGQHEQGRGRRGPRGQRGPRPRHRAAPRRDARAARADRRTRAHSQHHRRGRARPGRQPGAGGGRAVDAALRLGPRERGRGGRRRGGRRHPAGGRDRLAQLVHAADRLERGDQRSREGALCERRTPPLEAHVGRGAGPVVVDDGRRRRIERHRDELRDDRPRKGARSARHLRGAAGRGRAHVRGGRAEPLPARIHRAARGQRHGHRADGHRPARVQHVHRPIARLGLPEEPGRGRRIGAALRGPRGQRRTGAGGADRGRRGARVPAERLGAEGLAGLHRSAAVRARPYGLPRARGARAATRARARVR